MGGIRITRRVQVVPADRRAKWRKHIEDYLNVNFPSVALLVVTVVAFVGFVIGLVSAQRGKEEQVWEYGDGGFAVAVVAEQEPLLAGEAPLPAMAVDPLDWYSYLRQHPDLPHEFLKIKPNKNGEVLVAGPDYVLLEELTGGLPEELPAGSFETKWDFFAKKNIPLEAGEDWHDAMGLDKSYMNLEE